MYDLEVASVALGLALDAAVEIASLTGVRVAQALDKLPRCVASRLSISIVSWFCHARCSVSMAGVVLPQRFDPSQHRRPAGCHCSVTLRCDFVKAGEEIRTLDIHVGNVTLYH